MVQRLTKTQLFCYNNSIVGVGQPELIPVELVGYEGDDGNDR